MHKDGIKKLLIEYKSKKEKNKLIATLTFLDENRLFVDNKGKDLISELVKRDE